MIAALANSAWLATSTPAWFRYLRALQNPEAAQRRLLARLIARNSSCKYGCAHGFGGIRTYAEFRASVPIVDYEALAPWIARIMQGEREVLTVEAVTRLVPTGGSSGGRKLIPYTASFQRELNAAISPWMCELSRAHPSIAGGPAYWSISPSIPKLSEPAAVPIGFDDDSAYLGGIARRLAESTFAVPSALRDIPDAETSRYVTLLCLLRARGLRLVSVWHPSFLALMLDTLAGDWEELLYDVENGGCSRASSLPRSIVAAVSNRENPQRARELRDCDPRSIDRIWPQWKVLSCWGDAQAALPLAALRARLPGVSIQPKGLLATEVFVTIPFRAAHPLAITSHFFEFEDSVGNVHLPHELQRNEQYSVIVTTGGGLWRYRLGDIVEVDAFVGATPSLRFLGRGNNTSDLCGEKLTEVFATRAIAEASLACAFESGFTMLAPERCDSGIWRYTLFCEGSPPESLAHVLDKTLRENPHYDWCRRLGQLAPLHCCSLPTGSYAAFCRVLMDAGQRLGDIKPRSLSSRLDWRLRFPRIEKA